jgi:branched-chain amino acid transport system ATP-binding protein
MCWQELDMPTLRAAAIAEVDAAVASGLTFPQWRTLIGHPEDPGVQEEGQEFEGDLAADEEPWDAQADEAMRTADDQAVEHMNEEMALAPKLVEQVATLLDEIARRGVSILLVEQKLAIALRISNRLYVMGHGRIVFEGDTASLQANVAVRKEWLEV